MPDWRDQILKEFVPGVQPITVVADPDGLLTEPLLSQALAERGFELLLFEDSISFRFAYESRCRSRLDTGSSVDVVVLLGDDASGLIKLPFDVLTGARKLSFGLVEVFPHLSYPVLRALEPQYLDLLYEAQLQFSPGVLGENATKDFILRHVFEIAAELIKSDADLLRTLLRRHYRLQVIPRTFVYRLAQVLYQNGRFADWPLTELLTDRSLFFAFLQERWPRFLGRLSAVEPQDGHLSVQGPADLPFDHPDVRVYIDNLFVEGMLQPVEWTGVPPIWAVAGVRHDPHQDRNRRFLALLDVSEREMPGDGARHGDWLSFARIWAEANLLSSRVGVGSTPDLAARVSSVQTQVDTRFSEWLQRRFGSLHSLPASPPVMVHHIGRFLAAGMHNQVRQWAAEGFLSSLMDLLLSNGFVVYLTADHGNVEAVGCGRPKEGLTAEIRGERARIYSDPVLRANVAARFPSAISWKPLGLPEDFLPLLSSDRSAFVPEGYRTVAHGGATLEETIVPFIRVVGEKL